MPGPRRTVSITLLTRDAGALIARPLHVPDLAIACDSGLMHLARTAHTPCLPPDIRNDDGFDPLRNECPCAGWWNSAHMEQPGECHIGKPERLSAIRAQRVADEAARILGLR